MFLKWIAGLAALAFAFKNEAGAAVSDDPKWTKFDSLFKRYGSTYGVPWRWLKATAIVESSLGENPRVKRGIEVPQDIEGSKSYDGLSWGLMQVILKTANAFEPGTTAIQLNNPDVSVRLAAKLFQENIKRFGKEDLESIARAYNGGPKFGAATLPYWVKWQAALKTVTLRDGEN